MKNMLSKSQFIRGQQCYKSLWLYKHRPELRTPPDAAQQAVFDMGTEVGEFAQQLFPGGETIEYEGSTFKQKIQQTKELMARGAETIYEATFQFSDILVMADILHRETEGWELYEVKASSGVKDVYIRDVSVQYYVLKNCGLHISKACLVHLNSGYVRRGDINVHELFAVNDLTDTAEKNGGYVQEEIEKMRRMLEGTCPDIDIGTYCSSPYPCDFRDHCWSHVPDNSVFDLSGKGINKFQYYYSGLVRFTDLDLYELNDKQRMQVDVELNDNTIIDKKGIQSFLDQISYPLYYLDFETFMPAVPEYDGTGPFQAIPFQYSLHAVEKAGGELRHFEYLAESGIDPREELARKLTELIPENSCIITYNASFEKRVLKQLADQFPGLSEKLLTIHDNIIDLMVPFRKRHYYVKEMKGSYSIKYVLPALVPELSYGEMAVSDGSMAMNVYSTLHLIEDKNEAERIRHDLLEYCKLDTLGMVRIVEKLKGICSE
jgi:hypothetical protein